MEENIETMRPFLIEGIPELDIPSIDPIDIGNLTISGGARSNSAHVTNKKLRVFGTSSFELKKLQ